MGDYGTGTLNIVGGGAVAATGVSISTSQSRLTIDVGNGSRLSVTGGTITNYGTVQIRAGRGPRQAQPLRPFPPPRWSGSGTYQTIGGTWNASSHVFTVSDAVVGAAGHAGGGRPEPKAADLDYRCRRRHVSRREFFGDHKPFDNWSNRLACKHHRLIFARKPVERRRVGLERLDVFERQLHGRQSRLSLAVHCGGYSHNNFDVWDYNGNAWTALAANDLAFDGSYANFTAYALNGYSYAVTGVAAAARRRQRGRQGGHQRSDHRADELSARPG